MCFRLGQSRIGRIGKVPGAQVGRHDAVDGGHLFEPRDKADVEHVDFSVGSGDEAVYELGVGDGVTPGTGENDGYYNVLIHLVLTDPASFAKFKNRICELINSHFWKKRLHSYIDALAETISSAVQTDPNDRNADLAAFQAAIQGVKTAADQHEAYLRSELSCPNP